MLEFVWIVYNLSKQSSANTLFYIWFLVATAQLTFVLLIKCIVNKGINKKDKSLEIWWLCCFRVYDPYYKPVFSDVKNKKSEV